MTKSKPKKSPSAKRILAIDIGGTGLKAAIVGPDGAFLVDRLRIDTPHPCPPKKMVPLLLKLVKPFTDFDRVAIGFPGFVRDGTVITAPNLGTKAWAGFDLAAVMQKKLGQPVLVLNDADMQGFAVIKGKGLEMVCTLGTGFGTAWFLDGRLLQHVDLTHMAVHAKYDMDNWIGDHTRKKIGDKHWNKRVEKLIPVLETVVNYDRLYLGGGNSQRIAFKLPRNVHLVSNDAGMEGGAFAWRALSKA
jgi:polyphosphate glucokinase